MKLCLVVAGDYQWSASSGSPTVSIKPNRSTLILSPSGLASAAWHAWRRRSRSLLWKLAIATVFAVFVNQQSCCPVAAGTLSFDQASDMTEGLIVNGTNGTYSYSAFNGVGGGGGLAVAAGSRNDYAVARMKSYAPLDGTELNASVMWFYDSSRRNPFAGGDGIVLGFTHTSSMSFFNSNINPFIGVEIFTSSGGGGFGVYLWNGNTGRQSSANNGSLTSGRWYKTVFTGTLVGGQWSQVDTAVSTWDCGTDGLATPAEVSFMRASFQASSAPVYSRSQYWGVVGAEGDSGIAVLDNFAVAAVVPEPSTYAMALAGLACGGYSMWRRQKRSQKSRSLTVALSCLSIAVGFLTAGPAYSAPITIDMVTVGDPGNTADTDPAGYGAVADSFKIMKYEWTNSQYVEFLNAVDPNGSNPNSVYNEQMDSNPHGGIIRANAAPGSRWAVKANMGDKPVNFVSWWDAARVANWLHNGQGSGNTETGAYTLNNATSGNYPARNSGATFYIPTEDQWYKAAYYTGGSTNAGYWDYATQSDTAPTAVTSGSTGIGSAGNTGNFANVNLAAIWNEKFASVTTVGTNGGPSAYGTFDMSGNVWEWNDLTGAASPGGTFVWRGRRGGDFINRQDVASANARNMFIPVDELASFGFDSLHRLPCPSLRRG